MVYSSYRLGHILWSTRHNDDARCWFIIDVPAATRCCKAIVCGKQNLRSRRKIFYELGRIRHARAADMATKRPVGHRPKLASRGGGPSRNCGHHLHNQLMRCPIVYRLLLSIREPECRWQQRIQQHRFSRAGKSTVQVLQASKRDRFGGIAQLGC